MILLFSLVLLCAVVAATLAGFALPNVDKQYQMPMLLLIAIFAGMAAWLVILGSVVC